MMDIDTCFSFDFKGIRLEESSNDNYLSIDNTDFIISSLTPGKDGNKGGNSFVYYLYDAQDYDDCSDPCYVLKISKYKETYSKINQRPIQIRKNERFRQEIEALYDCKSKSLQNIIEIFYDGNFVCKNGKSSFPFYIMEPGETDLQEYMNDKRNDLDEESKLSLCLQLAQGLKELFGLGYYHRDIKPDNIFFIDNVWKIGDLGLVSMRNNSSMAMDREREWIGPRGWMTPESMNKFLSEGVSGLSFDCIIDHQSDIFQLGKVFWYILQGNAPIGCIKEKDFVFGNSQVYALLKFMLNHDKRRRPQNIDEVIRCLNNLLTKYYQ